MTRCSAAVDVGLTFGPALGLQITEGKIRAVFRTNEQLVEHQRQPLSTHTQEEGRADVLRRMRIWPVSTATLAPPDVTSFAGLTQLLTARTQATTSHGKLADTKTNLEHEGLKVKIAPAGH